MAKKYYNGMISEDRSSVANLPQSPVMKEYPKVSYMDYSELDDTLRVIDNQMNKDANGPKIKKGPLPEKY